MAETEDTMFTAERLTKVANRASSNINTFITEFPDVTVYDLMEYIKMLNVYGAKIIASSSFKNGVRPNVRTVITDLNDATLQALDNLIPMNPELADDYVWEEPKTEVEEEKSE